MAVSERVTVTLPGEVVRQIDRLEPNRSRFFLEAVRHELEHRRREELRRSLENPHPESEALAQTGFGEWARSLPAENVAGLVDLTAGTPVRWVPGEGWVREDR